MYYHLLDTARRNLVFDAVFTEGLKNGMIHEWDDEFLNSIRKLNVFTGFSFSLLDIFKTGVNIGSCYLSARSLSFLFEDFKLCNGYLEALTGTEGSMYGEHVWLEVDGYIYDTSLMLKIDCRLKSQLGYKTIDIKTAKEMREDPVYCYQAEQSKEDNSWYFEYQNQVAQFVRKHLDD